VRSAIYEGIVTHRRHSPISHRFAYRMGLPLLDLDEIEEVCRMHPLWSYERPNVVSFRRNDFLSERKASLTASVRDMVEDRLGVRPAGPISLLTHVRTWGWLFNPISLYFCFDRSGSAVEALVAEVTNTPWHERHAYVVGGAGRHTFDKALHVSPFFEMNHRYELEFTEPGPQLTVRFGNRQGDRRVFDAVLSLKRRPMTKRALGHILWNYPFMTLRVSAGIYRQAVALRRAGVPFVAHPADREPEPGRA
jgi:uncharacterized protein